jgi:hypothetical protein
MLKKAPQTLEAGLKRGSVVYVRYWDHALYRDTDPQDFHLMLRETVGWLDEVDGESIKIVWERFTLPSKDQDAKMKETGLKILKKAIVELRRVA